MRNDKSDEINSIFADERKDAMEGLMTKRVNLMIKLMETDMEVRYYSLSSTVVS